jgi:hypothetical protein
MTAPVAEPTKITGSLDSFCRQLSPAQSQAAMLIAFGRRQREVAKLVGVSHETVSRWWHIPEFEYAVSQHQQDLIAAGCAEHMALLGKAVDRLEQLLDHPNAVIKLRAIQLVLHPLGTAAALKPVELRRTDPVDFEDFMRVFMEERSTCTKTGRELWQPYESTRRGA